MGPSSKKKIKTTPTSVDLKLKKKTKDLVKKPKSYLDLATEFIQRLQWSGPANKKTAVPVKLQKAAGLKPKNVAAVKATATSTKKGVPCKEEKKAAKKMKKAKKKEKKKEKKAVKQLKKATKKLNLSASKKGAAAARVKVKFMKKKLKKAQKKVLKTEKKEVVKEAKLDL